VSAVTALSVAVAYQAGHPVIAAFPADPIRPPQRLVDTGLYASDGSGAIDPRNRHFSPQYPLWSDGLTKRRWIQLPAGATIDAGNDTEWRFPAGTKLWKEFSLDGRKVETRLLWKTSSGWVFATYVWNAEGTDALLAPEEGVPSAIEVAPGRRHGIPSRTDCIACHGSGREAPLGLNALQLSTDRDPNAIHGEPLQPDMLTLQHLVEERRLLPLRSDLLADPPRIRTNSPATRSVLGYLAANCGMCHNGRGEIAALGPTIKYADLVKDGDAVAQGLVRQKTAWQLPGAAEGATTVVHPGAAGLSALFVRMRSRSPSSQMPPLGTVVRDQQAIDAIQRWIEVDLMRAH
jgi:hypothetical protein